MCHSASEAEAQGEFTQMSAATVHKSNRMPPDASRAANS